MARASKFREKVTFEGLSGSIDDYGNPAQAWSTLFYRFGDIMEQRGNERIQSGALSDGGKATVRVRSDSSTQTLTTANRAVFRGATWAIHDIIQLDQKNTVLEIIVSRNTP